MIMQKYILELILKKTDIRRDYQKLMEFYANATSLLIGIFRVLVIIFNFIDGFYAENSITKKIFFLKEFEDSEHFDIFKKGNKIKELLSLTNLNNSFEYSNVDSFETNFKDIISDKKIFNDSDLKTYNNYERNKSQINLNKKVKTNSFYFIKDKAGSLIRRIQLNKSKEDLSSASRLEKEDRKDNLDLIKIRIDKLKNDNIIHNQKSNYSFNIFEIIISSFCKCCMTKRIKFEK